MTVFLIVINVLFIAILACLIKPSFAAKYNNGNPPSRWIFFILLLIVVAIRNAVVGL
ncbi:hypothetical protein SAMN05421749_102123 [Acinetobacter marinus]|uniref:Uncharacterized protein n=1 Tax=Acinetobacter marinus TaxID=281375 RepID=A0A1G6HDK4_9GAMM|nr:hypothetical protein SAMN05421749_102123 [Acinetobacter marinus]